MGKLAKRSRRRSFTSSKTFKLSLGILMLLLIYKLTKSEDEPSLYYKQLKELKKMSTPELFKLYTIDEENDKKKIKDIIKLHNFIRGRGRKEEVFSEDFLGEINKLKRKSIKEDQVFNDDQAFNDDFLKSLDKKMKRKSIKQKSINKTGSFVRYST